MQMPQRQRVPRHAEGCKRLNEPGWRALDQRPYHLRGSARQNPKQGGTREQALSQSHEEDRIVSILQISGWF